MSLRVFVSFESSRQFPAQTAVPLAASNELPRVVHKDILVTQRVVNDVKPKTEN